MRKQKGFTLIELLIVVAIIGILAAIAIPNLLTAMQRSRQKRTMADIRTIATAWEARATDLNRYDAAGALITWPAATEDITEVIEGNLKPTYIRKIPLYDGWGTLLKVGYTQDNYAIKSFGADQEVDTVDPTSSEQAITTNSFDCDMILSQGNWCKYPGGIQGQ